MVMYAIVCVGVFKRMDTHQHKHWLWIPQKCWCPSHSPASSSIQSQALYSCRAARHRCLYLCHTRQYLSQDKCMYVELAFITLPTASWYKTAHKRLDRLVRVCACAEQIICATWCNEHTQTEYSLVTSILTQTHTPTHTHSRTRVHAHSTHTHMGGRAHLCSPFLRQWWARTQSDSYKCRSPRCCYRPDHMCYLRHTRWCLWCEVQHRHQVPTQTHTHAAAGWHSRQSGFNNTPFASDAQCMTTV